MSLVDLARDGVATATAGKALNGDRPYLASKVGGGLNSRPEPDRGAGRDLSPGLDDGLGPARDRVFVLEGPRRMGAARLLDVMKDEPPRPQRLGAQLVRDAEAKRFLILWSSTIPGRFPRRIVPATRVQPPGLRDADRRLRAPGTRPPALRPRLQRHRRDHRPRPGPLPALLQGRAAASHRPRTGSCCRDEQVELDEPIRAAN